MAPPSAPFRKNDPVHVQKMMEKYKIRILGPVDTLFEKPWPANLGATFEQVKRLGVTDYDTYTEDVRTDVEQQQPWRYQRLQRARGLFQAAGKCIRDRATEQGWRLEVEQLVCGRFSVEVACKTCRGRLWRSEEEVVPEGNSRDEALDQEGLPSLRARQERRKPCKCPPNTFRSDLEDSGINPLFERRAEMAIVYTEEMKRDLRRREDRPDRIIGLSKSRTLERLLWKPDQRQASLYRTVGASIRTTPFEQDGEPVLFPFLIMEAKSEKSGTAFTNIDMQTAFSMRELVLVQDELQQNASERGFNGWEAGPLVWYFSYRGEQWRLHGAYPRPNGDTGAIDVVRLWCGDIDSARGALQLLLLVDYICDWARDRYRESIIRSLAAFSHSNRQGTVVSDVFSLRAPTATPALSLPPHAPDPPSTPRTPSPPLPPRTPSLSLRWDAMDDTPWRAPPSGTSLNGDDGPRYLDPEVVRTLGRLPLQDHPVLDIRFVISRSRGALITKEVLERYSQILCLDDFRDFAFGLHTVLRYFGFFTTWDKLNEAQAAWHKGGKAVDQIDPEAPGPSSTTYIAAMTCIWYVCGCWEPVRELDWVAIEESAIPQLNEAINYTGSLRFSKTSAAGDFEKFFRPYRELCVQQSIAACLLRSWFFLDQGVNSITGKRTWRLGSRYWHVDRPTLQRIDIASSIMEIHDAYEKGRLGVCPTLLHGGRYEHIISRIDTENTLEQSRFSYLLDEVSNPFEKPLGWA